MSITKTIGGESGRDFATWQLLVAAVGIDPDLPVSQTQDIIVEVYGANSDGSAGEYSGTWYMPGITSNGYSMTIKGMTGSICNGGQAKICSSTYGIYFRDNYDGFIFLKNMEIDVDEAGVYLYGQSMSIAGCIIKSSESCGLDISANSEVYLSCSFVQGLTTAIKVFRAYIVSVNKCVCYCSSSEVINHIWADAARRASFYGCTLVGAYIAESDSSEISTRRKFNFTKCNCVYTGSFFKIPDSSILGNTDSEWRSWLIDCVADCNIYNSTDGSFFAGASLEDWNLADSGLVCADPQFVNTNGDYSELTDFLPADISLVWGRNRSQTTSPLTGDPEQNIDIGAFSVFTSHDYPEPENVLTTTTTNGKMGLYVNPEENVVKLYESYGYEQTGAYIPAGNPPAVPDISVVDVGNGVNVSVTIDNTDSDSVNYFHYAAYGSTSWTMAEGIYGDGTVELELGPGSYWAYAISTREDVNSITPILTFAVADTATTLSEVHRAVIAALRAEGTVGSRLYSTEAVILGDTCAGAVFPCLTLDFSEQADTSFDEGGVIDIEYRVRVYSASQETSLEIARAAADTIETAAIETDGWIFRNGVAGKVTNDTADYRMPDGQKARVADVVCRAKVFSKS